MDISAYLGERKKLIDSFIGLHLSTQITPVILHNSMTYSLSAGGKRIRPVLCIAAHEACGGNAGDIIPYASALEFIHTYSLIHDDLPAMDNDDLRRGMPTNHKVFGEGMAILAGDALMTEAFCLLSKDAYRPPSVSHQSLLRVVYEVSLAAGAHGMVSGQAQDLLSENAEPDETTLAFIHSRKTAALITIAVRTGGMLAGCDSDELSRLTRYGENIGLAFQIIDDILDIEGETEVLGKTTGSDEKKKKMTYPGLYGVESSAKKAEDLVDEALNALESFPERADPLREIARYIIERKS